MKIVVTDLLRKVEIEAEPGESLPSIVAVDFSEAAPEFTAHRIRVDVCQTGRMDELKLELQPLGASDAAAPIVTTDQPASSAGEIPQHIRVADWEACEPGHQAVS